MRMACRGGLEIGTSDHSLPPTSIHHPNLQTHPPPSQPFELHPNPPKLHTKRYLPPFPLHLPIVPFRLGFGDRTSSLDPRSPRVGRLDMDHLMCNRPGGGVFGHEEAVECPSFVRSGW